MDASSAQNTDSLPHKEGKTKPDLLGFSTVAVLWWWGSLFLYSPTYLNITGVFSVVLTFVGAVFLIISFSGAILEIGKFRKNDGINYLAGSALFILPAIGLHAWNELSTLPTIMVSLVKFMVLILFAFGGALMFQGIAYALWKKPPEKDDASVIQSEQKVDSRKANFELSANIIVAVLSLITAIIALAGEILP
jgi:hypothetical protein